MIGWRMKEAIERAHLIKIHFEHAALQSRISTDDARFLESAIVRHILEVQRAAYARGYSAKRRGA
jgi:hypothetical protein